jgi:signal transduction histidine kinase
VSVTSSAKGDEVVPGSIRFRLTAWYTLLLAIVLLAVGFGLSTLLERRLRDGVDARLLATAQQVYDAVRVQPAYPNLALIVPPPLDPFASPGQVIQVVDLDNEVMATTENLGGVSLSAAPVSPGDRAPAFRTSRVDQADVRSVRLPMVLQGRTIGAIIVGESLLPLERTLNLLPQVTFIASVIGVGLAAAGGWLLAGRALRPVDAVTATAAKIAVGGGTAASLATRLTVPATHDEVARLAMTFNTMLDRLEASFAAQGRFVADASHELRTPLTAIRGNVEVLQRQTATATASGAGGDDMIAALDDLQRESARMARLLEDLLTLARTDAPVNESFRREPVRLDLVACDAVRTARAIAAGQHLTTITPAPVMVSGDPDRLVQLVLILVENAIRHTPPEGEITVQVDAAGGRARLTVRDTGEGIAAEHLPHIFERFYRVDSARTRTSGGTGLGLAIAQAITRAHGGQIRVESTVGVGTAFTMGLPLLPSETSVRMSV